MLSSSKTLITMATLLAGMLGSTLVNAATPDRGRPANESRVERIGARPTENTRAPTGAQRVQDRTQTGVRGALNPVERVQRNTVRRVETRVPRKK